MTDLEVKLITGIIWGYLVGIIMAHLWIEDSYSHQKNHPVLKFLFIYFWPIVIPFALLLGATKDLMEKIK